MYLEMLPYGHRGLAQLTLITEELIAVAVKLRISAGSA